MNITTYEPAIKREDPTTALVTSRQTQEVQGAIIMAKRFPRDVRAAEQRIIAGCARPKLAAQARYTYPRGGTQVMGPSIRLAEHIAQNWGNLDFGLVELEQRDGESQMMAYCWDLETNTRQVKIFTVKHERKAHGKIVKLDDPRDVYEMASNQGARRLRACILGVVPGDIVEAAEEACEATLANAGGAPIKSRVKEIIRAFAKFGVTESQIAARIGHHIDAIGEQEIVQLRGIYTSLKDGMATAEDYFGQGSERPTDEDGDDTDLAPVKRKPGRPRKQQPEPDKEAEPETDVGMAERNELASLVTDSGFTFDDLRSWAVESGTDPVAGDWESFATMPGGQVTKFLNARNGLLMQLRAFKKAQASEEATNE